MNQLKNGKFEVGDVVQYKSGGSLWTVVDETIETAVPYGQGQSFDRFTISLQRSDEGAATRHACVPADALVKAGVLHVNPSTDKAMIEGVAGPERTDDHVFTLGAVLFLKSGGPPMVTMDFAPGGSYHLTWCSDGDINFATVPAHCLVTMRDYVDKILEQRAEELAAETVRDIDERIRAAKAGYASELRSIATEAMEVISRIIDRVGATAQERELIVALGARLFKPGKPIPGSEPPPAPEGSPV